MKRQIIVVTLLLAGCATPPPRVDYGNESSVLVTRTFDRGQAFASADAHCQRYGKHAQLRQTEDFKMVFDCVE